MFALGLIVGVCCIALFLSLSFSRRVGSWGTTALNPYYVATFYTVLVQIDFIWFEIQGFGVVASTVINAPRFAAAEALMLHNLILLGFAVGCFAGTRLVGPKSAVQGKSISRWPGILLLALVIPFLIPVIESIIEGRSLFLVGAENHTGEQQLISFFFSMAITPVLIFYFLRQRSNFKILVLVAILVLLFATGSRTRLLYAIIPFMFAMHYFRYINLKRRYFVIALVAGLLASTILVNFRISAIRDAETNISIAELADVDGLLHSNDVAFAEIATIVITGRKSLSEYPMEGFVGAALAPVPRAIVPFKPMTGSVQYTMTYDSRSYYRFGRSLAIGGITEIMGDYPLLLGVLIAGLLGGAWAALATKAIALGGTLGTADQTMLYVALFAFLRIDIQATGQLLWAYYVIRLICTRSANIRRKSRGRRSSPPSAATVPVPKQAGAATS
jgi:hypothetical protein